MIKIRYRALPPGRHAQAEPAGRHTIVYLLPGLTAARRRAALRRVWYESRMGYGPQLSAAGFAVARGVDRVTAAVRCGAAVVRLYPVGSLLSAAVAAGLAALCLLASSVSVRVLPAPGPPGRSGQAGRASVADPGAPLAPSGLPSRDSGKGRMPGPPGTVGGPGARRAGSPGVAAGGPATGALAARVIAQSPPSPAPSPGPVPPATSGPVPPGGGSAQHSTPSAVGTAPAAGVCVDVGLLGVCLDLSL